MTWLSQTWSAVWPNLLASLLWVPVTMIHVTRSNRKHMGGIKVDFGIPDTPAELAGEGDHLPGD